MTEAETYSGFVAIVGRPSVGKSTLLNCLLQQKVAITARKPQTTRHQILGIETRDNKQIVFVDTPGMHIGEKKAMNRYMNKTARAALIDVDAVLFVVVAGRWTDEDTLVLEAIKDVKAPVYILINKIDLIQEKAKLLPYLQSVSEKCPRAEIIPLSAETGEQVSLVKNQLFDALPTGPFFFPPEQVTDKGFSFRAAEVIREKLIRFLGDELPYATTVQIEAIEAKGEQKEISAVIWVERETQKIIILGKRGDKIKQIGREARLSLNEISKERVHLNLWVKVKENWADSVIALKQFGYDEE